MATTISLTGVIVRADTLVADVLHNVTHTQTVTLDRVDTLSIPASAAFTGAFNGITGTTFLGITSSSPLLVSVNGLTAISCSKLYLCDTTITSLVISNPASVSGAVVRLVMGGD